MHHFIARVLCVIIAALALVAFFVLAAGAEDLYPPESYTTGCYQIGVTSPQDEGFPIMFCPEDGAVYYVDLDGTDGSLGTVGDGRWIRISG